MLAKAPYEFCVTAPGQRLRLESWLMYPYPADLLRGRCNSQDLLLGPESDSLL